MTAKKKTTASYDGFSEEERGAMKDRAAELKRRGSKSQDGEADLLAKIAELGAADRAIAEKLHAIITKNAPELAPRTYYGMPAWAKDGKVLCFFQPAEKFKTRYSTFGFNDGAHLDDGTMFPTAWAITKLTAADEKRIAELMKQAVS
ncbi:hypothetical protein Ais01nite_01440 [Asanoa ishikariensis]|uniref:Uncharacterized conserved protein YdhG, YjbR/CyaY-like superfamily, DUF1801 family n=1 Tax=Asanoa ishikariensis TaxID=137265 RepID=A0A1H3TP46_9ACTN|nr:DUF1801 domain-containing protein [Asanoa ishikariensis]GIF62109.1 hypothetical protein Ais01nite_01440 [Asanoa ishikariensis]SDZ51591.1 Uncharacterized conserved protein YdhG, YjbR/CyaY-like superfamily, DUF1801 family [Asanoa ishikariensis]